jgi:hypothetical protein
MSYELRVTSYEIRVQATSYKLEVISKGGHPLFKSTPLQLRNIADNLIDCEVAD